MILFVILVGLCLGSFVNALVWRLKRKRNWVNERSECGHCHHQLAAKDLIPVVSWLLLRGRCRYCRKPIEDSPLIEVITGLLFLVTYQAWPRPLAGLNLLSLLICLLLVVVGMALTLYDLKYMKLPNKLIMPAAVVVGLYTLTMAVSIGLPYLRDAALGLLAFGGLFYVLFQVSNGKWIGGGDVKLGFVLGAWLADYRLSILSIFVASAVGTVVVALLAIRKKVSWQARLPFGPLLLSGAWLATLYGTRLLDWYTSMLLISY